LPALPEQALRFPPIRAIVPGGAIAFTLLEQLVSEDPDRLLVRLIPARC
jgi:hypothetical protein